jgi:transketolase
MRDAFFTALTDAARTDERIWALTGDLGIGLFDDFQKVAPGRYLNAGIAEQALVGVAAGLAYAGQKPVAYSIAPFITARAHEQVRIDIAMTGASVVLAGVGGGVAYGYLGPTHHGSEDLAAMRALPGMTVLAPADPAEAHAATLAALAHDGPVYLRLGKNGEPALLSDDAEAFQIGAARVLRHGTDATIVSTGAILAEALSAADDLAADGIHATILHCPTLKPFDAAAVCVAAAATKLVISVEEHNVTGGLGSAVAEALADNGVGARLIRLGLPDTFAHAVGSQRHLLSHYGLDARAIARRVREAADVRPLRRAA